MTENKFYTILEVAEILRVHRRTVYTYLKNGDLKAFKPGKEWRVTPEDLEDFIKRRTN